MSDVAVCQNDYLAADDLKGKVVTVQIAGVGFPPDLPSTGKKRAARQNKSVLVTFAKGSKAWICNPTNQWAMAVLFGTKTVRDWVGRRVSLIQDKDVDIDAGAECMTVRVHGSLDATPERRRAYQDAWHDGSRTRGALCRRLKRTFRMLIQEEQPQPISETEEPAKGEQL